MWWDLTGGDDSIFKESRRCRTNFSPKSYWSVKLIGGSPNLKGMVANSVDHHGSNGQQPLCEIVQLSFYFSFNLGV